MMMFEFCLNMFLIFNVQAPLSKLRGFAKQTQSGIQFFQFFFQSIKNSLFCFAKQTQKNFQFF